MNGLTEEELLLRNLKDAGCSEEEIGKYLSLETEGRGKGAAPLSFCHTGRNFWIRSMTVRRCWTALII